VKVSSMTSAKLESLSCYSVFVGYHNLAFGT